jgi:RND superfamily putative drug exporter
VITSAGVVHAGTFLVLGVLPLVELTEIGVVVALGVLLDTLIVRILVPALLLDLGDRVWWPPRIAYPRRRTSPLAPARAAASGLDRRDGE